MFCLYQPQLFNYFQPSLALKKYRKKKSEVLVNNTCKQKKLNRVMLNGDDKENGFKANRSNYQKKQIARAAHFSF